MDRNFQGFPKVLASQKVLENRLLPIHRMHLPHQKFLSVPVGRVIPIGHLTQMNQAVQEVLENQTVQQNQNRQAVLCHQVDLMVRYFPVVLHLLLDQMVLKDPVIH